MNLYTAFIKQLIKNYLIGSFIAVVGVGSLFIFRTLSLSSVEIKYMVFILGISLLFMIALELYTFMKHVQPIRLIFSNPSPSKKELKSVYRHTQQFPILAFKRTVGPHLFGLSIPSVLLTFLFIKNGLLHIPYAYILFAFIGAVLIASFHGMIEFYLTSQSILPILEYLRNQSLKRYQYDPSSSSIYLSIRKKFLFATIFFSVFPLLLFSIASQIRLGEFESIQWLEYWSWAVIIIAISVFFSLIGSYLFYRDIGHPIDQLTNSMKQIEYGRFIKSKNQYNDEFASLVNGFNQMVDGVQKRDEMNQQLIESFYSVLSTSLDARDRYTAGHSQRVSDYSVKIGIAANLTADELTDLKNTALLHDIGKIGVPDVVLLKDGALSDEEFEWIKKHPSLGARILEQVQPQRAMEPLIPGVMYHHERFDGKGYPKGLKEYAIPKFGRIIAVADAFDAMTSDRPYRKGMTYEKAIQILQGGSGTQWDPKYVDLFVDEMKDVINDPVSV